MKLTAITTNSNKMLSSLKHHMFANLMKSKNFDHTHAENLVKIGFCWVDLCNLCSKDDMARLPEQRGSDSSRRIGGGSKSLNDITNPEFAAKTADAATNAQNDSSGIVSNVWYWKTRAEKLFEFLTDKYACNFCSDILDKQEAFVEELKQSKYQYEQTSR